MTGAAHHLVGDAERVHDVEGEQRDVRRLEDVAAGIEHEIRRNVGLVPVVGFLPKSRQRLVVELDARDVGDVARHLAEALHAEAALLHGRVPVARHGDPRHPQKEPRIDAVVAGLDALAGEHAGIQPICAQARVRRRCAGCR